jgi:hypothetical protein
MEPALACGRASQQIGKISLNLLAASSPAYRGRRSARRRQVRRHSLAARRTHPSRRDHLVHQWQYRAQSSQRHLVGFRSRWQFRGRSRDASAYFELRGNGLAETKDCRRLSPKCNKAAIAKQATTLPLLGAYFLASRARQPLRSIGKPVDTAISTIATTVTGAHLADWLHATRHEQHKTWRAPLSRGCSLVRSA